MLVFVVTMQLVLLAHAVCCGGFSGSVLAPVLSDNSRFDIAIQKMDSYLLHISEVRGDFYQKELTG